MAHIDGMLAAMRTLEELGYEVETPDLTESQDWSGRSDEKKYANKDRLIRQHLDKISHSDAILVFNSEKRGISGYIGGNTLMEMAFGYAQNLEIFMLNHAKAMGYADEIYGMQPIVLEGNITAIDTYFKGLPKTFVSSKSPIKLRAVSRGLRRAGIRTNVLSRPINSKIAEQPQNIEETYEGAQNRHKGLRDGTKDKPPTYIATIESGLHAPHSSHGHFEAMVVVLEKVGSLAKTGITVELEYPKEMTDKVPSKYADMGILVQTEYGTKLKDPFPIFTNGKIERLKLVEDAVFNVAVQLPY